MATLITPLLDTALVGDSHGDCCIKCGPFLIPVMTSDPVRLGCGCVLIFANAPDGTDFYIDVVSCDGIRNRT